MGTDSSKKNIVHILENSATINNNNYKYFKIEYKFKYNEEPKVTEDLAEDGKEDEKKSDDSFDFFEDEVIQNINNPKLNVKNIKKFPYCAIGTISVQFPISDEIFEYTCFLIDSNVVVTLASNLNDINKGGKAKSIVTSFSEENVKWENIFIQEDEKKKKKLSENIIQNETLVNLQSKLAVILYNDDVKDEWLGVEKGKKEDFSGRDLFAVFSFKEEINNNNNNIIIDEEKKINQSKFREILVWNRNKFLEAYKKGAQNELEFIKQIPGSPLYYRDYNNGAYVIAIINDNFEFQYFDEKTMKFLKAMVHRGKMFRKKVNKTIDEDNIIQLNLEGINLGPSDMQYLTTKFDLKNLRILDLNSNSIKSKGALYLSQNKFSYLEFLNISNNQICDEGVNYIANGSFKRLNCLHLSNNSITSEGIKSLVKAEFINNLIILSLSENKKIGDNGMRLIKEHKEWKKLKILNLESIGLTDIGLNYLSIASNSMLKLKELNLKDNKFTYIGNPSINALRMNHIYLILRPGDERKDDDDYDYQVIF